MRKLFSLFMALLATTSLWAYDFQSGDLYYNITSDTTVEVTYQRYGSCDNYENLKDVVIPEQVTHNNITYLVTSIGEYTFCLPCHPSSSQISSITIPNSVTSIGAWAFYGCSSLTSITIPNSVTSIGTAAFSYCSSLTSITIPNGVTSIVDYAFTECSRLSSITIPNSVTSIIGNPFSGCSSLVSMVVESGNTKYDSRNNCNAIIETATKTLIAGCQNTIIPNSVTSIGVYAFSGCGLTSITIPNSVTSIGGYAFSGCGLTSITIPNSVTSIGTAAFSYCSSLTSITIPNSVTSIGNYAFNGCSSLTSMVVEEGNTTYDSRNNCNAIIETATNTLITGCQNTLIPNSVTSIGKEAFRSCSSLTSITIPNSVTSIGKSAFGDCWSLTSVTISNSVTSIGDFAFSGCFSLTSITIPNSVKSIGGLTFDRCTSLTSITIPNSVTSIGDRAFSDCSSLNSVICEAITPPTLNYNSFTSSPICYIPFGTLAAYQSSAWASQVSKFVEQETAAPTTITYELNGGVTNDYGWMNKADMFATFIAESGCPLTVTYDELKAQSDPITTIAGRLTADHVTTIMSMEKWDWLEAYVMQVQNADANATALVEGTSSAGWRYALAAFFLESQRTSWPKSANFSHAGTPEAFMPVWKHGFANPTEPTVEWVLNAPYKEGATFGGWYATADFSGKKITTVNAETTGTLYAKWVEYIPTIAEVRALADDTETKVAGVVNHVDGKNIYIQDYTGGILVCANESATCKVGDKIVAKGVKVIYGGAPEVKNAVIESAEAASVTAPTVFETLAALVADSLEHKYFATNVTVPGLKIVSYDSYNNPTLTDGVYSVPCKIEINPTVFPIGTKVTVTAVAGWYNGFQFVGDAKNIVIPVAGVVENFTYPTRSNGRYALKNNWVISNTEDNYAANKPGSNDYVRGMAAKDGIMYFIDRYTKTIVRVDGKTGDMLAPIVLQGTDTLFRTQQEDGTWADGTTLPYNDIKFDQAGNCLIGACMTGATKCQTFFIYVVDLATGVCTKLIEDYLWDNPGLDQVQFRFDAFGCAGDVTKNGVVMAADGNGSWNVYRWLIEDGVAGEGEQVAVSLDPTVDQSLFINAAGFGTAPQIFPRDEVGSTFYVDGFNTLPMLFNESGRLQDDFINVPTGVNVWNNAGDTIAMNANFNGLVEFQVGEEHFLLMVAMNNVGAVPTTYALYKFADEDRMFEGMEPLWYFPHNGLGTTTNGCRTAPVSVEVEGNTANIYLYTVNNGYASYTFNVQPSTHTLTVKSNDSSMGTVSGSGVYEEGENVQISATANYGYHFSHWNDGNTQNPRTVKVTEDKTYTAYFERNIYQISATCNSSQGKVESPTYAQYLDNITMTAIPNDGYRFDQWNDGNVENPRIIVLTQDTALVAQFVSNQYTITTQVNNSESGQVFGGGVANYGEYVELSAVANYGYHFAQWSDGNTDNPRIVQVVGDATYTAYFDKNTYTVTTYCNSEYGVVTPSTSGAYLDIITLEAISNIGYSFSQWSDGNTDNPRALLLTQDTILMAEFTQAYSGKCGDDLYWAYDNSTQTLSISGMGDMYDYTATTQPWVLFKEQIIAVDIANTATTIGASAFEGCKRLGSVNIGVNVEEIGENAFAGCTRLYDIYCYPTYPPFAETSSFANYNVYLYVPCVNIREYEMDIVWGNFKYIKCMGAEGDEVEDGTVEVTTSTTSVTITWPTEENANTYIIEIKKDGVVFCRLTFNADGQLLSISFAPGRNGNHPAQYATKTTNGLRFTVTGLEEGTNYTYDVISKDENNESIETYSGEFRTQSNTPTDVDNINASTSSVQKLFRNGQLIIIRDGVEYNAMGQEM